MAKSDWRLYEEYIYEKLVEWADGEAEVLFDQKLPGRLSGKDRQVDALITGRFAGHIEEDATAIVDCKRYSRKIHVKDVEAFMGLKEDVDTDMGLLITNVGFSNAAKRRATGGIKFHVVPDIIVAMIDAIPKVYPSEYGEPHYNGEFYEIEQSNSIGVLVSYHYPDESYPVDHPDDLTYLDTPIASGTIDEIDWSDDAERRDCARLVLRHYLGQEPSDDELDSFVLEVAADWEDGQEWSIELQEIRARTGLWANIAPEGAP